VSAVIEIALFDQYRGKGVPEGKKSLAFLVVMQDTQKTLTDEDTDAAVARLLTAMAQKHGAVLRS
jgi:phenylalanyl-tRNA synthetase beta chain